MTTHSGIQHPRLPTVDPNRLVYTLDILTDGSERTGHGAAFLTVRRAPRSHDNSTCVESIVDDSDPSHPILARYAVSGLPNLTARLCADQRLRLASTRAAFVPNLDPMSIIGVPSLLLALSNAGAEKLFVAGPAGVDNYVESMVDIVLGRSKLYPAATTCEVPSLHGACWWKVYDDEFLLVHAKDIDLERAKEKRKHESSDDADSDSSTSTSPSSDESSRNEPDDEDTDGSCEVDDETTRPSIAYIFTLKGTNNSFAILPPGRDPRSPLLPATLHPLPESVSFANQCPLSFVLFLDPRQSGPSDTQLHGKLLALCQLFYATLPNDSDWDPGLLMRASHQAIKLNEHLPSAFHTNMLRKGRILNALDEAHANTAENHGLVDRATQIQRVKSCASLIIRQGSDQSIHLIDRRKRIRCRITEKEASIKDDISTSSEAATAKRKDITDLDASLSALSAFYQENYKNTESAKAACDDNEIALEDDFDSDGDGDDVLDNGERAVETRGVESPTEQQLDPHKPHLIVLGTGCASPSPLRGSSGYALLLPTVEEASGSKTPTHCLNLAGLVECGEGCLTTLQRHLPSLKSNGSKALDIWLSQVRFIWISHAHLDHYSELPLVVEAIARASDRKDSCTCKQKSDQSYSQRRLDGTTGCSCMFLPIVIAPPKVLRYLDTSLARNKGKRNRVSNNTHISRKRSHCQSTQIRNEECRPKRLYYGVSNQDFNNSPFASSIRGMLFGTELPASLTSRYRPLASLQSVPVTHCPQAFALLLGVMIPGNRLFYLCYSGDTRPSQALVQACKHATHTSGGQIDLLIHETTFDDDDEGKQNAISKRHSTVMEAVEIAMQMNAKCCLFTHFSQRYSLLPPESATKASEKTRQNRLSVCSAVDGMSIPLLDAAAIFPLLNDCSQHISSGDII